MDSSQEQMLSASKESVVNELCMSENKLSICALTIVLVAWLKGGITGGFLNDTRT